MKILYIFIAIVFYLIFINYLFSVVDYISLDLDYNIQQEYSEQVQGTEVNAGVNTDASATKISDRWYGRIYEIHTTDNIKSYINLFYFLDIPIYNKFNFIYLHLIFIILLIIYIIKL